MRKLKKEIYSYKMPELYTELGITSGAQIDEWLIKKSHTTEQVLNKLTDLVGLVNAETILIVSGVNIKTGCEIIAEFMGAKLKKFNISNIPYYNGTGFGTCMLVTELKYDSSWEWIMPVVEKIDRLSSRSEESANMQETVTSLSITSDVDHVYEMVTKFIKWYNNAV